MGMTYDELRAIAEKRGTVRWNKSGVVEHLNLSQNGRVILARPLKQPKKHVIKGRPRSVAEGELWTYDCIEVDSATKEPLV